MPGSESHPSKNAEQPPDGETRDEIAAPSTEALISMDPAGNITAWNAAARRLFGFTAEEVMGKPAAELLCPPHLRATAMESLDKVARGQGPFHFETQRQKKDGGLIDVSITILGVRNRAGRFISAWVTYRDIGDRKQAQAELKTRLDREQALAALGQDALAAEGLDCVLDEAAAVTADTLEVDYSNVLELQSDGKALLLRAGVGWKPGTVGQVTVGSGRDSQVGYTLLSREPVFIEDLHSETRFHGPELLLDHGVTSGLSVIIGAPERPWGVLGAHSRTARKFTAQDANFLRAVASIIAHTAQRLATQQELRRSEAYFRSLIDNSFDVTIVIDAQGSMRFDNAAMRRLFGYEPGELVGQTSFDFVHPQEVDGARQALATALREGAASLECRLRRKDGAWLVCELALSRISDPAGEPAAVVSIRDVTGLKQAEQTEAFLASIVESSTVAIVGITRDGTIASWNRAAESLYGYRAREMLGQPLEVLMPEGESSTELIAQAMRGEHRGLHEVRRRLKDGRIIDVSVSQSLILDQAGAVIGMASFERSPSEETRLEKELQEAHGHIRGLIESSLDAMLTVGSDLTITDVNEQTAKLTATPRNALIGSRFDSYFTDPERAAQGIRRALSDGFVANYELALKHGEGEEIPVSFNASVFRDPTGQVRGVFTVARDVTQQKALEQQLRQAHAFTRGLIESSVDAMLAVDNNLIITDVNERMATLVETPKTMLIGSRFDRLFTDPERAAASVRQTLKEGSVFNYDLTLRALSGQEILVSFNASIFHDAAGQPLGVFGVARDVTEQRRVDQQLREEQIYSRSLIESSIDALVTVDPQLEVTDVNEQTVSLTGYSRPELLGSSFPTLFTDPERAAQAVRRALAAGFVRDYELTLRSAAGAELPVSVNASPFKDATGRVLGILAAARDVSERQRLERERSLLASIVASSPDAIYSYAPDTNVVTWNTGAERLLGYSAAEMIGRSFTVCVPLERRGEMLARENLVLRGKGVQQFETQCRRKDGSLIDVSITMSPITDNQGKVTAVASISRNITERKRFELELTKARDEALEGARVRSEFLANMSHEIRTPLNSIIGMTDMLLETALTDEQHRRALNVKDNAAGLLTILNDILNFSKLSAGKISIETADFDLEETFHTAVTPFAEAARAKGFELIASIEPDVPRLLRGDPDRLRQVIANLLSNAVKFTEHGEIVVRVAKLSESPAEAMLRFEVRDTGIGIAVEAQPRLFNAFSQVDPSIAIQYGGTGLGLAIARELVERMGGSIGVVSTPDVGSTFWFTARFAKQAAVAVKPPRAGPRLAGVRALIVDDREVNREILDAHLRSWKMAPDSVASPVEALRIMRREARQGRPYAIAVLDMEMPEMDGIELARQIRRVPELANIALMILSSGGKPPELAELNAELGLRGFMLKPVRPSELFDAIMRALSPPQAAAPSRPETAEELQPVAAIEPVTGPLGRPLHVLLAEDNAANREVALWQLEKLGCQADAVADGREVLEAIAKTPYDVIVMDCRMPKMDGYEAARQVRQREGSARHTKIVAMTAHALTGDREKCLAAGMDDYVSKPVTVDNLAAALRRVLSADGGASAPVAGNSGAAPGPALDAATMTSLRAKGDLLPNLINTVLGEIPEQLQQIADALAAGNHADAAIAAHSLKGTAKIFGAARMAELAAAVEQAADAGASERAAAELDHLKQECARVGRELEDERARQSKSIDQVH